MAPLRGIQGFHAIAVSKCSLHNAWLFTKARAYAAKGMHVKPVFVAAATRIRASARVVVLDDALLCRRHSDHYIYHTT